MARKKGSRRVTALYERLSRDDNLRGESNSIVNQKEYLEQYARDHGFDVIEHYTDDGFSGTNFKRPGFQAMLEDIKSGKIGTVIVKDMSRFGRNYLQVGFYTEIMFPQEGVRFIAINSNFDSNNPHENEFTPFLNIMNEYYARDTSEKIKSVFDAKMRQGYRVSGSVPYGYTFMHQKRQKYIVDPVSAKIVRRIFEMKADGVAVSQIAKTLTQEGVLTPSAYTKRYHPEEFHVAGTEDGCCQWNEGAIYTILHRKEYLGHTVLKKYAVTNFKLKSHRRTTEDEQYFFPNTHEPIVTQELWDKVQRTFKATVRHTEHDETKNNAIFRGLLVCADCGRVLTTAIGYHKKPYIGYHCGAFEVKYGRCSSFHHIGEEALKTLVLEYLRIISEHIIMDEEAFAQEITAQWEKRQTQMPLQINEKLKAAKRRYNELNEMISGLYENFVAKLLPERQYKSLLDKYDAEQSQLEQKIADLTEQFEQQEIIKPNAQRFIEMIKKHKYLTDIDRELAQELIEKIVVYQAEGRPPNRTQRVDIYFNFIGLYELSEEEQEQLVQRKADEKLQKKKDKSLLESAKRRNMHLEELKQKLEQNGGHLYSQKECAWCGNLFWPKYSRVKCCSDECRKEYERERDTESARKRRTKTRQNVQCAVCGKTFLPFWNRSKYCSKACAQQAGVNKNKVRRKLKKDSTPPQMIPCKRCGKLFAKWYRKVYCSETCRRAANREKVKQRKAEAKHTAPPTKQLPQIPCKICGKMFTPLSSRNTICSKECAAINRRRNIERHNKLHRERLKQERRAAAKSTAPPAKQLPQIPCKICGKMFTPSTSRNTICSKACAAVNQRRYIERYNEVNRERLKEKRAEAKRAAPPPEQLPQIPCKICGKMFTPSSSRNTICSKACAAINRKRNNDRNNKLNRERLKERRAAGEVIKRKYSKRPKKGKPLVEIPCKICGRMFMPINSQNTMCSAACKKQNIHNWNVQYWIRVKEEKAQAQAIIDKERGEQTYDHAV